jgi:hypothetical protein
MCKLDTTITTQIDLLLKFLTFLVAVGLAVKAIWEYVRTQRWKRFEFVAGQLKEFNTDPQVRQTMAILDWENREVELFPERKKDKTVRITSQLLTASLHPTDVGPDGLGYTEEQVRIRELFDVFFDKLTIFGIVLRSGLVRKKDIEPHLRYWLERLTDPRFKGTIFVANVTSYVSHYGYKEVSWLLKQFGSKHSVS